MANKIDVTTLATEEELETAGSLDTAATLASRLKVSIGTIRNWTNAGALPAIKLKCGRLVRYDWPSVRESLLRKQREGTL